MSRVAKLTPAQAAYLRGDMVNGKPQGLVRKGCLAYRWGGSPSMGYVVTALGQRSVDFYKDPEA